jgi:hypothetical protein
MEKEELLQFVTFVVIHLFSSLTLEPESPELSEPEPHGFTALATPK